MLGSTPLSRALKAVQYGAYSGLHEIHAAMAGHLEAVGSSAESTARGERHLFKWQDKAIVTARGAPFGECRLQ
jgi:hypothetical protein